MRKIKNPWLDHKDRKDYNCFACSPYNENGLHLEFWEDGDEVFTKWNPDKSLEGWVGVVHGGIQATLIDEVAGWLVMIKLKTSGVTSGMNIKYHKPLKVSKGEMIVRGRLLSFEKRIATIECIILDSENETCASGTVSYFVFPERIAKAKYQYPGIEAFYE